MTALNVTCHNYNGKIRMREADKEEGGWITLTSPNDLFILGFEIDFKVLNFQVLFINCLDLLVELQRYELIGFVLV